MGSRRVRDIPKTIGNCEPPRWHVAARVGLLGVAAEIWLLVVLVRMLVLHRHQAAVAAVGEALRESQTGPKWKLLSEAERHEIMQVIAAADGTLSARQRLVYLLFVEGYPATRHMEVLRKAVSRATDERGC